MTTSDVLVTEDKIEETHSVEKPRTSASSSTQATTQEITASADIMREYVAASIDTYSPWFGSSGTGGAYLRQLPNPVDDLMLSFGTRLYEDDMMRDPQVNSVMSVLCMAVLCQGVQYANPIKEEEEGYDLAEEILDLCSYMVQNLRRPMQAVRYELLEGMLKMGHKLAELIFSVEDAPISRSTSTSTATSSKRAAGDSSASTTRKAGEAAAANTAPDVSSEAKSPTSLVGSARQVIVVKDIKCRAHNATAFVVDAYNNVIGISYIKPGDSLPTLGSFVEENIEKIKLLPTSIFMIPTHKARNGDPRGRSHLESIYSPWWKKQQLIPQHMAFVARFAQPSLVANLPPEAKDIPVFDADNNITSHKSIVQATTQALVKVKGGAAASFINTEVQMLEAKTEGKVIFDSYDYEDQQIAKGVLWQTLSTEQSAHMASAAGATHQDVFAVGIQFMRDIMEWSERNELLRTIVLLNYGEEAARKYTPIVSYGEVQVQDIPKTMAALAQFALAGGIDPSMWPEIRAILGLPAADKEEEKKNLELARATKEAQIVQQENFLSPNEEEEEEEGEVEQVGAQKAQANRKAKVAQNNGNNTSASESNAQRSRESAQPLKRANER